MHQIILRSSSKNTILQNVRHFSSLSQERRVVVTGMGIVTPFGQDVHNVFEKILKGESAIKQIEDPTILETGITVKVNAPVDNFIFEEVVPKSSSMITSRFEAFAMAAAKNALKLSNWEPLQEEDFERAGVAIGSGIGCVEEIASAGLTLKNRGGRKVSAYTLPKMLANLAAGHVSIQLNFQGPNHCVSTACATGAHAIGDAYRFIKYNDADVMIAGGTETGVSPLSMSLFSRINALSREDNSKRASIPFSSQRNGFVMGEGCGLLFLEELEHAKRRGATIYAEIAGYGLSSDAHHVTSPPEGGKGALLCMKNALRSASIDPEDIGYINAHATSTPLGDSAELSAIRQLFLQRPPYLPSDASQESLANWIKQEYKEYTKANPKDFNSSNYPTSWEEINRYGPLISSTKGSLGHALGAAGSIESILTILTLYYGQVPPTVGISLSKTLEYTSLMNSSKMSESHNSFVELTSEHIDARFHDLAIVTNDTPQHLRVIKKDYAMTNSFGFGGSNASLIFKKYKEDS